MKIQFLVTVAALLLYSISSFGQAEDKQQRSEVSPQDCAVELAHFVLQAGSKSSKPLTSDEVKIELLDANAIESISVLKGQAAIDRYGEKGRNGIVTITFKGLNVLPPHTQEKMTEMR